MAVKVLAAPGPVSYPLVVAEDRANISLEFSKEGSADAVADSVVSLIRRGLRVDYVTVRELMTVYPELRGPRVGVWRRGSAADVLVRAAMDMYGVRASLVYADEWQQLYRMLSSGEVDSAVLSIAMVNRRPTLEAMVGAPGACGVSVLNADALGYVREAYELGVNMMRRDPEASADLIASRLPIRVPRDFVLGIIRSAEYFFRPAEDVGFTRLVMKYLGNA